MKTLIFLLLKICLVFMFAGLVAGFLIGWFYARHKYRKEIRHEALDS